MSRLSSWPSSAGDIKIKDMDTKHLYNVRRLLKQYAADRNNGRNNYGYDSHINGRAIHEWVADVAREIERRSNIRYTGSVK